MVRYVPILKSLGELHAFQFASLISGSQYVRAYDLVNKYVPAQASVLDWGTGTGHFSYFLLDRGYHAKGYALSTSEDEFSGLMKERFPKNYEYVVGKDSTSLPFQDASFDAVMSIGVLEHVRDSGGNEVASLAEIKRVLKPGGVFICFHFPNRFSWIEAVNKYRKNKYSHNFKYGRADIRRLVSNNGMHLLECRRYGLLPRLMFRSAPNLLLLTKLYNASDTIFSFVFNPFCQNFCFVAQK